MNIYNYLLNRISEKGAAYLILIDPDKISGEKLTGFVKRCENAGVDGFLVGGSLMMNGNLSNTISVIKKNTSIPVVIFPGGISQVSSNADAILFISLVSGRNPEHLIGKQILAAPVIKAYNLETIPTGYILVESGSITTVEYISGSKPVPRQKPEIAVATALAAQYLGMKMIYLEGGSGAQMSVPNEMISIVSKSVDVPVIAGGGIRTARDAREKVESGAGIIVTGNYFEDEKNWDKIKEFADAVHVKLAQETAAGN
ncbi:MAG: geranylgeranylglyceryl/heptaprenylglyceryl phosphate synthase [Bacteroidota bacterium]|jgi:putative glycerol-1-phosphate prenyltransferase|nr:geranylgeranylglyceryl/heptaprenylglyceryl phosphate synthase [Ignavibacteria bacterium]MCU7513961.1 geranylgeranylglyceryl/heptaprenylglyceryl phosphate synthase [Ignavibacteria bacterium]MCU7526106.1 geranylgeranylglyceryl/heptaprenylglyceryl phosphate synthase [Ignavibacteria bacterium]